MTFMSISPTFGCSSVYSGDDLWCLSEQRTNWRIRTQDLQ